MPRCEEFYPSIGQLGMGVFVYAIICLFYSFFYYLLDYLYGYFFDYFLNYLFVLFVCFSHVVMADFAFKHHSDGQMGESTIFSEPLRTFEN